MGGGQKKNAANKKALLAQKRKKAEAKSERAALKNAKKKGDRADSMEEVLAQLDKVQEEYAAHYKVTTESSGVPSRRANATFVPCPVSNSLYLFGGEFFDGRNCYFYQDLFRYNIDKKQWHTIYSPNSPGPRSAHAMVASPADGGKLWLFGGEFASMNQTTFHHYRDLWSFDIKSQTWERFDTRIRPSARSGHRMALYKNFLVLFGGFHDSGIRTTYLSDLWLFDLNEYRWYEVQQRPVDPKPRARSGFSMMPCPEGIVLHGGYCKEYTQGKTAKGIPLEDTWLLRLDQVKSGIQFSSSDAKWEKKRKVGGFSPSLRSGTTMATWSLRGMGIMFGGVFDDEADEEHMTSVFYNDLYGYNISQGRWVSLNIKSKGAKGQGRRRRRKPKDEQEQNAQSDQQQQRQKVESDESEDDDNESDNEESNPKPDAAQNGASARDAGKSSEQPSKAAGSAVASDPTQPVERYNAMLAVQGKTLFLYGGILERASMEATLDDLWQLDLTKLDQWVCLKPSEVLWSGQENDSDIDDEDAEGEDLSDSDFAEGSENEAPQKDDEEDESLFVREQPGSVDDRAVEELRQKTEAFLVLSKDDKRSEDDRLSTPLPGENLRAFYDRTKEWWARKAYETSDNKGKNLRRDGFQLAEERFETYKPMLAEIERIQASAALEGDAVTGSAATTAGATGVDSRHRR